MISAPYRKISLYIFQMDGPASGGDQQQELPNIINNQNIPAVEAIANIPTENTATFLSNLDPRIGISMLRNSMDAIFGAEHEEVTFSTLLPIILKNLTITGKAYFVMLLSLLPATEMFYYIIRFVMDATHHIMNCSTWKDRILKGFVFAVQMIVIFVIIVFVFGTLLYPIYYIFFKVLF